MLSERLRELEEEGIVVRQVLPETPVKVEYALTDKGRALEEALGAIGHWAEHWQDHSETKRNA
jgi:DNA-binding HxlR family transcriptional regulator